MLPASSPCRRPRKMVDPGPTQDPMTPTLLDRLGPNRNIPDGYTKIGVEVFTAALGEVLDSENTAVQMATLFNLSATETLVLQEIETQLGVLGKSYHKLRRLLVLYEEGMITKQVVKNRMGMALG